MATTHGVSFTRARARVRHVRAEAARPAPATRPYRRAADGSKAFRECFYCATVSVTAAVEEGAAAAMGGVTWGAGSLWKGSGSLSQPSRSRSRLGESTSVLEKDDERDDRCSGKTPAVTNNDDGVFDLQEDTPHARVMRRARHNGSTCTRQHAYLRRGNGGDASDGGDAKRVKSPRPMAPTATTAGTCAALSPTPCDSVDARDGVRLRGDVDDIDM